MQRECMDFRIWQILKMGSCAAVCALLAATAGVSDARAVDGMDLSEFAGSPLNYRNSDFNFDNSTSNPANSPMNWNNNRENSARLNVIGLLGIVKGYAVRKSDGGINYFDNDGVRIGYSPDGGVNDYEADGEKTDFEIKQNLPE